MEVSAASCTSFNSEEGFGSPATHFKRDRQNVFELEDNEIKVCLAALDELDTAELPKARTAGF